MTTEASGYAFETRWWFMPRGQRVLWQGLAWLISVQIVVMAFTCLWDILHSRLGGWHEVSGLVIPCFGLLMFRRTIVAVGLEGDNLLIRRAWPGHVERVPLSRVLSASVTEDSFGTRLSIFISPSWPLYFFTYNSRRARVDQWDDLLTMLKPLLEAEAPGK